MSKYHSSTTVSTNMAADPNNIRLGAMISSMNRFKSQAPQTAESRNNLDSEPSTDQGRFERH